MRPVDIILRSLSGIRQNKLRVALTATAIAIGAFSLSITFALGEGARAATTKIISSTLNDRIITVTPKTEQENINPSQTLQKYEADKAGKATAGPKLLANKDIDKIKAITGVEKVIRNYSATADYIQAPNNSRYIPPLQQYKNELPPELVAGKLGDSALANNQIVVPETFLDQLGFADTGAALGKNLAIVYYDSEHKNSRTQDMVIVGVSKKPLISSLPSFFLISEDLAKQIADYSSDGGKVSGVSSIEVVTPSDFFEDQRQQVANLIEKEGYSANTTQQEAKGITDIINGLQLFLGAFATATLLAAVFGIINTELIGILERRSEIGLMKAIGMHSTSLFSIFTLEAGWIGIIGTAGGILLAFLASFIINPLVASQIELFGGETSAALILTPATTLGLVAFLFVISLLAGSLPARTATKLDPIDALRTE